MTRTVRVGSTQKHQKTPGEATPWDELSKDAKKNSVQNGDKIQRIQKGRIEKKQHNLNLGGPKTFTQSGFQTLKKSKVANLVKSDKAKTVEKEILTDTDEENESGSDVDQNSFAGLALVEDDQESDSSSKKVKIEKPDTKIEEMTDCSGKVLTKNQRKKARRKMKLAEEKAHNMSELKGADNVKAEKSQESEEASTDKALGKNKSSKKRKNRQLEIDTENTVGNTSSDNMVEKKEGNKKPKKSVDMPAKVENGTSENVDNKDPKSGGAAEKTMTKKQWKKARRMKKLEELKAKQSSQTQEASLENPTDEKSTAPFDKDFLNKKQLLLEKLERRKPKDGSMVLPSKVERKIFNIKRKLMDKGLSPKILADIVRKERKREEEKFKKAFCTRVKIYLFIVYFH